MNEFHGLYEQILRGNKNPELLDEIFKLLEDIDPRDLKDEIEPETIAEIYDPHLFKYLYNKLVSDNVMRAEEIIWYMRDIPDRGEHFKLLGLAIVGDDLDKLREEALEFLTQGNQVCVIYLTKFIPLHEVLRYGFVPLDYQGEGNSLRLEYPEVPVETLECVYDRRIPVDEYYSYQMFTEAYAKTLIKRHTQSTAILKWTYPNLLYKSQRMKTDMAMFRTPFSNTDVGDYEPLPLTDGQFAGKYYVPVIRYAKSLDIGLYYSEPKEYFCGTFFYYEPESTVVLRATNILVAQTKYSAMKFITDNYPTPYHLADEADEVFREYWLEGNRLNVVWEEGELKNDLMYTPAELDELLRKDICMLNVPQYPLYCGRVLDLYAEEDVFDQPLCKVASKAGIELIVLLRMVGNKQIVTEVLDTRDRVECLKNLVYTV